MNISTLIDICEGQIINDYDEKYQKIRQIRLNSREVRKRDLFIALKGARFDGHNFVKEALKRGAYAVIVTDELKLKTEVPLIKVKCTYESLLKVAKYKRELYPIPLIAVTGSTGKTMVKDLIANILKTKYKVLRSNKSDNNHVGIPKTLFNLNKSHELIVMELGMNHQEEIKKLSGICQPTEAIITNIGTAHLGNLGSLKKVLKAKLEIIEGMETGKLIINGDDKLLKKSKNSKVTIIKCGQNQENNLKAYDIKGTLFKTLFKIKYDSKEYQVIFNVPGHHLVNNVLLAIQVGLEYKIPIETIIQEIATYKTKDKRMEIIKIKKNNILIEDCYNSSFESLKGALELIKSNPLHKIIILGDILELGQYSDKIHKKIDYYLKRIPNKEVLLVGDKIKVLKRGNYHHFNNNKEVISHLKEMEISNALILVKGSRLMALEEITEYLKKV